MLLQKLLQTSPMSASIYHIFFVVLVLAFLFLHHSVDAQPEVPTSRITVVGVVFCDTCSTNSFSRHSYFLPGADVQIQCKFQANSPKTNEQITFSVTRTTDKFGVYKLEIPHVDGVDCVDGMAIESFCQASLIESSSSACDVPGLKTATNEISVKSKQDSLCIYSLKALSYKPSKRNSTLCGISKESLQKSASNLQKSAFNSSKFFLPYYFPPNGFFLPHVSQLSSVPKLPFPFPSPPSLSFPFTPPPALFQPPPPPPAFNLGDPRTWIPNIPILSPPPPPPPPPAFNLGDPRTWIPNIPILSPPPPPAFKLGDPRPWIPNIPLLSPPSPPPFNLGDPRTWIPNIPILSPPPPAFNPLDPRTWTPSFPPSHPSASQSQEQKP